MVSMGPATSYTTMSSRCSCPCSCPYGGGWVRGWYLCVSFHPNVQNYIYLNDKVMHFLAFMTVRG